MKKVKGQPITGATPEYSQKSKPFVPNAKDTSANEQTMVGQAPSPFKNRNQTGNMNTGAEASGGVSTLEPHIASGMQHSSPGVRSLPQNGPIGQNRAINQSGQVNGRFGTKFPRKIGQNGAGYPSKRNARFYGE